MSALAVDLVQRQLANKAMNPLTVASRRPRVMASVRRGVRTRSLA